MLTFHIITLFPESIEPYFASSILKRAQEAIADKGRKKGRKPLVRVRFYNPRDYTNDKHGRVDRRPYGGGPGMVLEPESLLAAAKAALKGKKSLRGVETVFFSPSGAQFDAAMGKKLAKKTDIVMICGRYEGVDARVPKLLKAKHVSVGPFVLTGGELPAAIVADTVVRFVPGVLGTAESDEEKRSASPEVYTRPEILTWKGKKYRVPGVLLSGNHAEIEKWRKGQIFGDGVDGK